MTPSISDVMRSLSDCRATLDRLADVRPAEGMPVVRTTMFAEFAVEWHGDRWMLCTPLKEGAAESLARMVPRLKRAGAEHVAEFHVYHSELKFTDSTGCMHICDVVMQRMPDGNSLADCAVISSHGALLRELDEMQEEFRRIGFSHNNLKPENVIVTRDEHLVAVRCHFASFGEAGTNGDGEAFDSLRRLVESKPLADEMSDEFTARVAATVGGCEVAGPECEQRIRIRRDGLTGFADTSGTIVIEPRFDSAEDFREGRAEVDVGGRKGLIDKSGRYVIPARYEYLEYHDDCGISVVRSEGVWSVFDYDGNPTGIRHESVAQVQRMLTERMKITIEI